MRVQISVEETKTNDDKSKISLTISKRLLLIMMIKQTLTKLQDILIIKHRMKNLSLRPQ